MKWWVRADRRATAIADLVLLARSLGLVDTASSEDAVTITLAELVRRGSWLLIFDGATEPTQLQGLYPNDPSGQVLITSRNPNWEPLVRTVEVSPFSEDSAIEFLLRRTGTQDAMTAAKLARALGWLPLALEHAAGYCNAAFISLADYLSLYSRNSAGLLREGSSPNYPVSLATTWGLSLRQATRMEGSLEPF